MDRYQLAKLVEWAGTLRTRKRMQKVVYLLQAAGCPFDAGFMLHHYGPYSFEVAMLADEMLAAGLFDEEEEGNYVGRAFNYQLSEKGHKWLKAMEKTPEGKRFSKELSAWMDDAINLLQRDVRELEVSATILAFKRQVKNWELAVDKACRFKRLNPKDDLVQKALELARNTV